MYKAGDRFLNSHRHVDAMYILAQIGPNEMGLINLKDGNRWTNHTTQVVDSTNITEEEFEQIKKPDFGDWTLLPA